MDDSFPRVSFVSCMNFVPRGVAKAVPEKIELTEKELKSIIKQTAEDLRITEQSDEEEEDQSDEEEEDQSEEEEEDQSDEEGEELNAEEAPHLLHMGPIQTEGPDGDEKDDIIKPGDNLFLVGQVENNASTLKVYIFNKEEGSFDLHRNFILPWIPLCIEWLSHDPSDPNPVRFVSETDPVDDLTQIESPPPEKRAFIEGNLCAVGSMNREIQVWDLDIENCREPAFELGKKPNKKKKTKRIGHKEAVLDLSWNKNFTQVIASGSADETVLLWDLDQGEPFNKLSYFEGRVQSLCFHSREAQTLVSGCSDGRARVSDCRSAAAHKPWSLGGEIERVAWDIHQPFCYAMSNNEGKVAYVDIRQDEPLWTITAHEKAVRGLIISDNVPGLMVTVGAEGKQKVWDILDGAATQVSERAGRVGQVLCAAACPDAPYSLAVGGDNKQCYIELADLSLADRVMDHFGSRPLVNLTPQREAMES